MDKRQLIGTATRYIAGRHAVQTVYWRQSPDAAKGLVKTTKTCHFNKGDKVDSGEMFAKIKERYS